MRSPRRWAAAVELDFWVSMGWIHMKPIRGRWFEKCFQMTIRKRLEEKSSIFEEFLREIEPIQRMKRETVGEKNLWKISCYAKPYGDATAWKSYWDGKFILERKYRQTIRLMVFLYIFFAQHLFSNAFNKLCSPQ